MTINFEKLRKKITPYKLAKAMSVPLTTVYSWKNKIPAWRIDSILNTCQKLGIDVSDCVKESA